MFLWFAGVVGCPAQVAPPANARDLLGAHNRVRASVGVPPLTWSAKLEAAAKQWADSLLASGQFTHRKQSDYGENLYDVRGARATAAQVAEMWAGEARNYDAASNTCRGGATCGHYTQMIWRTTKEVGCAVAGNPRREVWVCYYSPPGNWEGQSPLRGTLGRIDTSLGEFLEEASQIAITFPIRCAGRDQGEPTLASGVWAVGRRFRAAGRRPALLSTSASQGLYD